MPWVLMCQVEARKQASIVYQFHNICLLVRNIVSLGKTVNGLTETLHSADAAEECECDILMDGDVYSLGFEAF